MTSLDLTPPRLYARTVEIADPGSLLSLLPRSDAHTWVSGSEGMVGWGEAVRHKPATMTEADEWWSDLVSEVVVECEFDNAPAGSGLVAFGSFVFDSAATSEQSTLIVPSTVVGRRGGRTWLTQIGTSSPDNSGPDNSGPDGSGLNGSGLNGSGLDGSGLDGSGLDGSGLAAPPPLTSVQPPVRGPRNLSFADGALSGPEWEAVVAEAVRRIAAGTMDKVVLARDLLAFADDDIDPRWLLTKLAEQYARCWSFLVDGLVGATPEMLVRREAGVATSRVLAGTIRRSGNDVADLALAGALSGSSKDLEEHTYAVRSVARALAPYSSRLEVPDSPYVLALPNVLHLATDVTAVAATPASSLALAAALHPSAAVCGTPTDVARATIAELEHLDRGRYAGPVGWIDARGDGEWGIALRCGQLDRTDPAQIRLFAGCGIVAGSDPAAELAESNAKLVPMRDALGD